MRRFLIPILLSIIVFSGNSDAAKENWSIKYKFEVVNPQRHLIEVKAEYVFPSTTDEVIFQMRDEDNHYTEGYRSHIRSFKMTGPDGNPVELEEDTVGVYRASGLKGKYRAEYFVVMDHYREPSMLGIDDTPLLWGAISSFPGASVCIYPSYGTETEISDIKIEFKLPERSQFLTTYEKTGPMEYRVPNLRSLLTEWWLAGNVETFVYVHDGDSVICGVSLERFDFKPSDIKPMIDSVLNYHVDIFGSLPAHRMLLAVTPTPTSKDQRGLNSFGAVGPQSFNCLLDEKVTIDQLGSQMGLFSYNLLTFWMPSKFYPKASDRLDWFTTGLLNYMQLKSMIKLGFISDEEFFAKLSRAYDAYKEQLDRKGIALQTMLTLPSSSDRSVYEFTIVAMMDFVMHALSDGEGEMEDALGILYDRFEGNTTGYTSDDLIALLDSLGSPDTRQILRSYFESANPIDFKEVLQPYGLTINKAPSGVPDLGFTPGGSGGLTVEYVNPDGPAKKAGLMFGDVLTEMRGFRLSSNLDIARLLSRLKPGDKISIEFMRGDEKKDGEIELGNREVYKIGERSGRSLKERELWNKYKS